MLNISELLTRVDNDRELLLEVLAIGKAQIPHHVCELRAAIARADVNDVQKSGHTLKGMLAQLAASQAAVSAGRLEQLARLGDTTKLRTAAELLEIEVARLMEELETYLASTHDDNSCRR